MYNEEKITLRIDPDHVSTIISTLVEKLHSAELMERLATDEQLRYQKEADTARKELKQYVSEYDDLAARYVSLQNKLNAMPDTEENDDDE